MYCIVYESVAIRPFAEQELRTLLLRWRAHNQRTGLTGLLLCADDGRILQVLEGQQSAVEATFARIATDCRHYDVVKLADGAVPARTFTDWSMGFWPAGSHWATVAGYLHPRQIGGLMQPGQLAGQPQPALLRRLLQEFVASMSPQQSAYALVLR